MSKMITIQFPNGDPKIFLKGTTLYDLALTIHPTIAEHVIIGTVNESEATLFAPIIENATVQLYGIQSEIGYKTFQKEVTKYITQAISAIDEMSESIYKIEWNKLNVKIVISSAENWTTDDLNEMYQKIVQVKQIPTPIKNVKWVVDSTLDGYIINGKTENIFHIDADTAQLNAQQLAVKHELKMELKDGSSYFLPKGQIVLNEIKHHIRTLYERYHFHEMTFPENELKQEFLSSIYEQNNYAKVFQLNGQFFEAAELVRLENLTASFSKAVRLIDELYRHFGFDYEVHVISNGHNIKSKKIVDSISKCYIKYNQSIHSESHNDQTVIVKYLLKSKTNNKTWERFITIEVANYSTGSEYLQLSYAIIQNCLSYFDCLIEHTKGEWPLWLAPVHVGVSVQGEVSESYITRVKQSMRRVNLRFEEEKNFNYYPYHLMLTVENEKMNTVTVSTHQQSKSKTLSLNTWLDKVTNDLIRKQLY